MRDLDKTFSSVAAALLFLLWEAPRKRSQAITEVADQLASDGAVEGDVEWTIGALDAEGYVQLRPPGNLLTLTLKSRELIERAIDKAESTSKALG